MVNNRYLKDNYATGWFILSPPTIPLQLNNRTDSVIETHPFINVIVFKTGTHITMYTMLGNTAENYFPKILSVGPLSSHSSECLEVVQNKTLR
jgi:tRNA pseudouridine-54 N-methylase